MREEQPFASFQLPNRWLMAFAVAGMAIGLAASTAISDEDSVSSASHSAVSSLNSNENLHVGGASDSLTNSSELSNEIKSVLSSLPEGTEIRWFNNRPIRQVRIINMKVTAYSPDEKSCGNQADGITASGYSVWTNGMKLVAADTDSLPFGTLLSIPGYDNANIVPVLDRGSAIKGNRLDVLFPTHEEALEWGVQEHEVIVWEYVDGKDDFSENHH